MDRRELEQKVLQAIGRVQELSGELKESITLDTRPIKDLSGFDSLRGIETTTLLEGELKCELDENVFVSEDGKRALKVKETIDRIEKQLKEGARL